MTLHMRDLENIEKGREEGRQEGLLEGRQEGLLEGREQGRREAMVKVHQGLGMTKEATLESLKRDLALSDAEAMEVLERYWKE